MSTISTDERREVARRLRELHLGGGSKDLIERTLSDAIGAWRESGMSWDFITERLADLIEPSESGQNRDKNRDTVQIESPAVQKAPECDREALLALASGLEADADRIIRAARNARFGGGPRMGEAKHDAYEWRSIARRIREALGVDDG